MENVDFKNLHLVGDTETDGLLLEFTNTLSTSKVVYVKVLSLR